MVTPQLIASLLWALAVTTAETSHQGNLVLKSFQRTRLECKQYLPTVDDSDGLCQSRCESIVLHSWNDCSGLLYIPYSRHFKPDCNDQNNLNRTLRCLDAGLQNVPSDAVCCRASVYWRCYRDQWGNLVGTPQLVPLSRLQISSTIEQCVQMMQVNSTELTYFARNHFDVSNRSRCLLRCILIRKGLYSDVHGADLDRMYVQCGGYSIDEEIFKQNATQCIDRLRGKCYDKCTMATRIVKDCFPMNAGVLGPLTENLLIEGNVEQAVITFGLSALLTTADISFISSAISEGSFTTIENYLVQVRIDSPTIAMMIGLFEAMQEGSEAFNAQLQSYSPF